MSALIELVRALPAVGAKGVEGLVAILLADALGLDARLEQSGQQAGRDVGLFDRKTGLARNIDIETKRYRDKTCPPIRELLGELTQVRRTRPETEIWVYVLTAPVSAAHVDELNDEAFKNNIDILILDCTGLGSSTLEILAASRKPFVLDWLSRAAPKAISAWQSALDEIRAAPGYEFQLDDLGQLLVSRYAADTARAKAHEWLASHVAGRRQIKDGLNQSLGRSGRAPEVPRPGLRAIWQNWLAEVDDAPRMLALLGGEGDGKTWTAIDALLDDPDRTPLIATSNMIDDGGAAALVAAALARQCGGDPDRWRARLEGPTKRLPPDFRILLLVDGLNEAPQRRLDLLLDELIGLPWGNAIDIIITCRRPFWDLRIAPFIEVAHDQITPIEVGPFDLDHEWPIARGHLGSGAASLPPAVGEALRNPRLWSFAYDLKDRLGGMSEITLEQLLVEHWRLRIAEREELSVLPEAFNRLIAHSVDQVRVSTEGGLLETGELRAHLARMALDSRDFTVDLAEIRDGVFFESRGQRLALRKERVPVALGLLLVERLIVAAQGDAPAHATLRAAAVFLDDLPPSDRVEIIVRTAVFVLLGYRGPERRRLLPIVLRHWVSVQNFEADFYRALAIVAAAAPQDCIDAIEDEACDDAMVGDASADLSTALRGRRDRAAVRAAMLGAATSWLRSYSRAHFPQIAKLRLTGLLASDIDFVEALADCAADFLSYLDPALWPGALAHWPRRRRAHDKVDPHGYHYDEAVGWLGLSGDLSDADAQAVIDAIGEIEETDLTLKEMALLEDLLHGKLIYDLGVERSHETRPPVQDEGDVDLNRLQKASKSAKSPGVWLNFADFYGQDHGEVSQGWLELEKAILDHDPTLLAPVVHNLLGKAMKHVREQEPLMAAAFATDHMLLLGEVLLPLLEAYRKAAKKETVQRAKDWYQLGSLTPLLLLSTERRKHAQLLEAVARRAVLTKIQLNGYAPPTIAAALRHRASDGDEAAIFAMLSAPATLLSRDIDAVRPHLVDCAFGGPPALAELSARRLIELDDQPSHALVRERQRGDDLLAEPLPAPASRLLIAATQSPDYDRLRTRVDVKALGDAALADGSRQAADRLAADFEALLIFHGGGDWRIVSSTDAVREAGLTLGLPERNAPVADAPRWDLDVVSTRQILTAISRHREGYSLALSAGLNRVSDDALITIERATGIVGILAAQAPPAKAIDWLRRLESGTSMRVDHKGLLVSQSLRFAFSADGPEAILFRESLAAACWSDDALLRLLCIAELEHRDAWLDAWIISEERAAARSRRVRAIVLRGWRANSDDAAQMEAFVARNHYERLAQRIATVRARRRRDMREAMRLFADAPMDAEAWLAGRRLVHVADRRLLADVERSDWIHRLNARRAVSYAAMAAGFEKIFARNEGELERVFAGSEFPQSMRPWGKINLYAEAHRD